MSDLSADQVAAFNANSGFMPENLGTLILSILFATLIVWGVWAIKGEEYIVNELIDEVRNNLPLGRENFEKILLLCRAKFYDIF